ncbi:hypothetical protein GMES_3320 [Paraglaciecola mesophila KMM 241]|uniref:Uncharacterized protein n=1 Tax=Paraglaciecola mesophila KMM 241 TaxID=1128912 RepID=K6Z9D9_9ALTE|nr:hypothetical protein [Paraglaciecola mesophila]GAC25598.1 hypothetical protein GMES_3320 [Paraglaciecola mesophila KMM 241]
MHLAMLHKALGIVKTHELPYTFTEFAAMGDKISSLASDTMRISSRGTPGILIGA